MVLKIGLSSCFFHADNKRDIFKGKTLLYLEESMAKWIMNQGAMPVLIPRSSPKFSLKQFLQELDGVILQAGSDVSPVSYQEKPQRPEWTGDGIRDQYEIEIIETCIAQKKPLLGVCRGAQILNVAFGGTLYQDIQVQKKDAQVHRNSDVYDQLFHKIKLEPGSLLENIYGAGEKTVNSVHHQGIKDLAGDLKVEARSVPDGIIEAVRFKKETPFMYAIQWHPEFQADKNAHDPKLLDPSGILDYFLTKVREQKKDD